MKKLPTAHFVGGVFRKKMPQTSTNWVLWQKNHRWKSTFDNRWKAGCKIAILFGNCPVGGFYAKPWSVSEAFPPSKVSSGVTFEAGDGEFVRGAYHCWSVCSSFLMVASHSIQLIPFIHFIDFIQFNTFDSEKIPLLVVRYLFQTF